VVSRTATMLKAVDSETYQQSATTHATSSYCPFYTIAVLRSICQATFLTQE